MDGLLIEKEIVKAIGWITTTKPVFGITVDHVSTVVVVAAPTFDFQLTYPLVVHRRPSCKVSHRRRAVVVVAAVGTMQGDISQVSISTHFHSTYSLAIPTQVMINLLLRSHLYHRFPAPFPRHRLLTAQ